MALHLPYIVLYMSVYIPCIELITDIIIIIVQ